MTAALRLGTSLAAMLALVVLVACEQPEEAHTPAAPIDEAAINDVWHKAKLRGVAFRAIGQEPGWLLEIKDAEEILLITDYGSNRVTMPYVEPVEFKLERRTRFEVDVYNTTVEIRGERCTDTMSGEKFEVSVTIFQPDRELHGCGRALF